MIADARPDTEPESSGDAAHPGPTAVMAPAESVQRFRWSGADPGAVAEYLQSIYAGFRASTLPAEGATFWAHGTSAGAFEIAHHRHPGPVEARANSTSSLVVVRTLEGGPHHLDHGRGRVHGTLKLLPTWTDYTIGWADVTVQTVSLDLVEVARLGAELSGLDPDEVAFTSTVPVSADLASYWCRLTSHVNDDILASDTLVETPLVRAGVLRQLTTALLATFPNTALEALDDHRDPGLAGAALRDPATVRRAVEFMNAHAHEAIELAEIAAAAQIGARSLQLAFRRHRDTTPLGYLRQVRLEYAHRDLVAAEPALGDRVETIAARWGFSHPGRFSMIYRERYGRSPSTTLRR